MSINAVSSSVFWLTGTARTAENQAIPTTFPAPASTPGIAGNVTRLSADNTIATGQNIPVSMSLLAAQETTNTDSGIAVNSAKLLDMSGIKATPVWELPEAEYQRMVEARETILAYKYRSMPAMPDLSDYRIDNQGGIVTSNALGAQLRGILPDEVAGTNGPNLAQARAEAVAELLGGQIVKADTAMTQTQFKGYPPLEIPEPVIDHEATRP